MSRADLPPACVTECEAHGWICDLDEGHDGDHECRMCPGYAARQRAAHLAGRREALAVYQDVVGHFDED